jgi:hypothetical protein
MSRLQGIEITKNNRGEITKATIDMTKYGKFFLPQLKKIQAIDDEEDLAFDKEFKEGITSKESLKRSIKKINEWWGK